MYNEFYSLAELPFRPTPDPRFLYLSETHDAALTALDFGIVSEMPIVLLSGGTGCGKTILAEHLVNKISGSGTVRLSRTTGLDDLPTVPWIKSNFGLSSGTGGESRLNELLDLLDDNLRRQKRSVLVIDEAQNLGTQALEELRLISNVNHEGQLLLQLVLIGHLELENRLQDSALRPFAQRIGVHYRLRPMSGSDTAQYIDHRLRLAGAERAIFDESAQATVYRHSGGVPRLVNLLCDRALVHGYAMEREVLTDEDIEGVYEEVTGSGLDILAAR